MQKIEAMIERCWGWLQQYRAEQAYIEANIAATRLHALLDAYEAVGGDDDRWRNATGTLRRRA